MGAWDPATSTTTTMNTFLFFSSLIAYASAGTVAVAPVAGVVVGNAAPYLVRAPAHDSASIKHHRLGGNFAYSTAEAHAYAEVSPQISTITHPVAETTHTHVPAPIATHQPSPIVRTTHVAQPIFKNIPTFGRRALAGPVRTIQKVTQPLVHETKTHTVQQVATPIHTPVHAVSHEAVGVQRSVEHVGYAAGAPVVQSHIAHGYAAAPVAAAGYAAGPFAAAGYAAAPFAAAGYAGAPVAGAFF